MADGSLMFDTKIDTKGFSKGLNTLEGQCNNFQGVITRFGRTVATVFSAAKIAQFGKEAINLASDLQEVQNVVDTAFGEMSYKMEGFANTCLETYGMSKLTAKEMGSTFMAMAKGMGQATDVASDKAVEITGRLGDIMSFYNKTASEADTIGRAIYSGETEPLKQIGIIMTETNLSAYALSKGYKALYKDMSAADKLLVRQEYFLERTSMAAGDFVKTQDSWANQTRILQERWKEFLSIMGNGLIKVFTPTVKAFNALLSSMIEIGNAAAKVFGWGNQIGEITDNSESASDSIEDMGDSIASASKKVNKSLAPFDELNVISTSVEDSADSISDALDNMPSGKVSVNYEEIDADPKLKKWLEETGGAISTFAEALKNFGGNVADGFLNFVKNIAGVAWPAIVDGLGGVADFLNEIDPEDAAELGEALGKFATAVLAFKGAKTAIEIMGSAGEVIAALPKAGPVAALATVLGLCVDALIELKETQDNFETEWFGSTVEDLTDKYETNREAISGLIEDSKEYVEGAGEAELKFIEKLKDRYLELADKVDLTDDEQVELKECMETLEEYIPGFKKVIEGETGSFEEQKEAVQELVDKQRDLYKLKAAEESLSGAYSAIFSLETDLASIDENIEKAQAAVDEAQKKYDEQKHSFLVKNFMDAKKELDAAQAALDAFIAERDVTLKDMEKAQAHLKWLESIIKDTSESIGNTVSNSATDAANEVETATEDMVSAIEESETDIENAADKLGESFYESFISWINSVRQNFTDVMRDINSELSAVTDSRHYRFANIGTLAMPKLATGTVAPAYAEYKAATESAYKDTDRMSASEMKAAFKEALAEADFGTNVTVEIVGDNKKMFKAVQKEADTYYNTTGKSPFKG